MMEVDDIDDMDDAPLPPPAARLPDGAVSLPLAAAAAQPWQAPDPELELVQSGQAPEPELELTPAASAAELDEQVAELMLRDRKGALSMVRAVLRRCTPAEFEEIDVKSLEAEAKRLQQEAQRLGREAEKTAKRQAKLAEEEARRQQKAADQEAKKLQREEAAAQKKRQKLEQASQSDATKQKLGDIAAKKGYRLGMEVEAPLLGRGAEGNEYEGSWYVGTIAEFQRNGSGLRALVSFERHEEMGDVGVECDSKRDDEAADDGPSLSVWVGLDAMRPKPPPPPHGFASMVELGQALEIFLEGGWWEVELLGSSAVPDPAPIDPSQVLSAGSRVRVQKAGNEYDGLCGVVAGIESGWVKVDVDEAALRLRSASLKATKNFRDKELQLLVEGEAAVAAAAPAADAAEPAAAAEAEPTYTARLLTAAAEAEGVYTVPLSRLRPGWLWRAHSAKWAGRWADKKGRARGAAVVEGSPGGAGGAASPAPKEEGGAMAMAMAMDVASLRLAWPIGKRVEVMQSDEGYEGSWYAGAVVGYETPLVVVKYDELFEGDDSEPDEPGTPTPTPTPKPEADPNRPNLNHLVNAEPVKQMRPEPPAMEPAEHAAWAGGLQPGAALDLSFDGGFWDVELVSAQGVAQPAGPPQLQLTVRALQFMAEHTVGGDELRPAHVWDAERGVWGARPPPKVHVTDTPTPKAAKKRPRAEAEGAAEQQPWPKERAAHFALGTKRKGRDGAMWEVDLGPTGVEAWVSCNRGARPPPLPAQAKPPPLPSSPAAPAPSSGGSHDGGVNGTTQEAAAQPPLVAPAATSAAPPPPSLVLTNSGQLQAAADAPVPAPVPAAVPAAATAPAASPAAAAAAS